MLTSYHWRATCASWRTPSSALSSSASRTSSTATTCRPLQTAEARAPSRSSRSTRRSAPTNATSSSTPEVHPATARRPPSCSHHERIIGYKVKKYGIDTDRFRRYSSFEFRVRVSSSNKRRRMTVTVAVILLRFFLTRNSKLETRNLISFPAFRALAFVAHHRAPPRVEIFGPARGGRGLAFAGCFARKGPRSGDASL